MSSNVAMGRKGLVLAVAMALAGCQTAQPTTTPIFTLGNGKLAPEASQPGFVVDPNGAGDTYFTLALPVEPNLPKHVVKVAGTPGSFNTALSAEKTPVVTSIIPNKTGFIIEGANLNKSTVRFYIGADLMTPKKSQPHQVIVNLPKGNKGKGILTVRDGALNIARTSMDATNVYVTGRVVVRFTEGAPRATVEKALQKAGIKYYRFPGMNFVVAYYSPDLAYDTVRTTLLKESVFTDVTRDTLFTGQQAGFTPPDPRYGEQWALTKINAAVGWSYTVGSPDAVVAVIDTGVQITHPDLKNNLFVNTAEVPGNNKDDDGNGRVDDVNGWNSYDGTGNVNDDNGHGTKAAGIIAAASNSVGGLGLAFNSRVIPIKALNSEGVGTSSSLIDGINYAVRNRASVINLSVGSLIDDAAVKSAIEFAQTFNVTTVAAMGNQGVPVKTFPAGWARDLTIVAVGATNQVDARPSWASYGDWMTVCAPGESILTTGMGSSYSTEQGTSYAAAYTSAYAAMIKTLKPGYTPQMVKDVIKASAVDLGDKGFDIHFGHGRINMTGALAPLVGVSKIFASDFHNLYETLQFPAEMAHDKNTETFWSSARRLTDGPTWLMLDTGRVQPISSIAALSTTHYPFLFPSDFTLEVSQDNVTWTTVAAEVGFKLDTNTWRRWNIPPVQARYVRMNITGSNTNPDNGLYYNQVAEFVVNGEENAIIRTTSSNYYGVFYPSWAMVDGDPNTFWVSSRKIASETEWAIADLGTSQVIKSFHLLSPPKIISEAFPQEVKFYVSNDKVNWTFVKAFDKIRPEDKELHWYNFPVPTVSGRYVRIEAPSPYAQSHGSLFGGFSIKGYLTAIAELTVNKKGN